MGSGAPGKKRARLPTFRSSQPSTSNSTSSAISGPSTSWVTTVKAPRCGSSNRNVSFADTHIQHEPSTASASTGHGSSSSSNTTAAAAAASIPATGNLPSTSRESGLQAQVVNKRKRKRVYTAKVSKFFLRSRQRINIEFSLNSHGLNNGLDFVTVHWMSSYVMTHCYHPRSPSVVVVTATQRPFFGAKTVVMGLLFSVDSAYYRSMLICPYTKLRFVDSILHSSSLYQYIDITTVYLQIWNGKFFEKATLASLGLRFQLGHDGKSCPCPEPGPRGFMVFDNSGAHSVNVDFCSCDPHHPTERYVQLLRMQWFPATSLRPKTAFTFDCLDSFHESTLQGKGNLYDFYHMLLRKTDNTGIGPSIVRVLFSICSRLIVLILICFQFRFPEIHRVFRLWRNFMEWKRSGRGHNPTGISGTQRGGTVVECPACPHPGRNLPDDWQKAGPLL